MKFILNLSIPIILFTILLFIYGIPKFTIPMYIEIMIFILLIYLLIGTLIKNDAKDTPLLFLYHFSLIILIILLNFNIYEKTLKINSFEINKVEENKYEMTIDLKDWGLVKTRLFYPLLNIDKINEMIDMKCFYNLDYSNSINNQKEYDFFDKIKCVPKDIKKCEKP